MALGELGLLPWEFASMTPREFFVRLNGHEQTWERWARLIRWVAQRDFKDPLTPDLMLHGQPSPRQ